MNRVSVYKQTEGMKYCLYLTLLLLCGCAQDRRRTGEIEGYVPIYLPAATAKTISAQAPATTKNPGKIYAYSTYIFQVDQGAGIHIIDNKKRFHFCSGLCGNSGKG